MKDQEQELERLTSLRRERREQANRAAIRLSKTVETSIRTTFVGSMSVVEDVLGFLWEEGNAPDFLLPQEAMILEGVIPDMDVLRDEIRKRIFDLGNAQLRAAKAELSTYNIGWTQ